MELFNDAHNYATRENAIKQLDKVLVQLERSRDNVRWLVAVNGAGRFVPVISLGNDEHLKRNMLAIASARVAVIS